MLTSGDARKLSNQTSPIGQPLEPPFLTRKNIALVVLGAVVILGLSIAAWWFVVLPQSSPPLVPVKTDQFYVASVTFIGNSGTPTNCINMTIQNIGSLTWTISPTATINGVTGYAVTANSNTTVTASLSKVFKIADVNWASGNQYSIVLLMIDGNEIFIVASAP